MSPLGIRSLCSRPSRATAPCGVLWKWQARAAEELRLAVQPRDQVLAVVGYQAWQATAAVKPPQLAHVRGVVASDDLDGLPEGPEPQHRPSSSIDDSATLLDDFVQIPHCRSHMSTPMSTSRARTMAASAPRLSMVTGSGKSRKSIARSANQRAMATSRRAVRASLRLARSCLQAGLGLRHATAPAFSIIRAQR